MTTKMKTRTKMKTKMTMKTKIKTRTWSSRGGPGEDEVASLVFVIEQSFPVHGR
jgi:hypothetical protein